MYLSKYKMHSFSSSFIGTIFIHHECNNHTTLIIDNNGLESQSVTTVDDFNDLSTDSFKAWILPQAGEHWLASGEHEYK